MRLRLSGLLVVLFCSSLVYGQGIQFFDGTWKEALAEAQKGDKIVFVDAYATWCGPCKRMAKKEFTKADVGDFYNSNFINVKLDMEKSDGMSFGASYPVQAFPTLFYLDPEGEMLKKVTGGQTGDKLIELAKLAIKSYDKTDKFAELYEQGKRDYDLMVNYVKELNKVGKPSLKISNDYIKSNPDISDVEKAAFLMEAVTESDSKLFNQLASLRDEAIEASSEEEYKMVVEEAVFATIKKAVEYDYEDLVQEAITQYNKADIGDNKMLEQKAYMEYYKLNGDYSSWETTSKKLLKKQGKKNPDLYKEHLRIIGQYYRHNAESMDYADEIYQQLIKKEDSTDNYLGYIQFLSKNKRMDDALKITNDAIKKAKSRKEDITNLERMLDYLKTSQG